MQKFIESIENTFSVQAKAIKVKNKLVMKAGEFQAARSLKVAMPEKRGSW